MAENVVQLASEQKFETMDKASLLMRLDELLEKYLNTLDLYQNARQQLTTQLTSVRASTNKGIMPTSAHLLMSAAQNRAISLWPKRTSIISPDLDTDKTTMTKECKH